MLAYSLNVFRVDYADLYAASLEPREDIWTIGWES